MGNLVNSIIAFVLHWRVANWYQLVGHLLSPVSAQRVEVGETAASSSSGSLGGATDSSYWIWTPNLTWTFRHKLLNTHIWGKAGVFSDKNVHVVYCCGRNPDYTKPTQDWGTCVVHREAWSPEPKAEPCSNETMVEHVAPLHQLLSVIFGALKSRLWISLDLEHLLWVDT